MRKYEIRKNKRFRMERLNQTFDAKNVVQLPHRIPTSLRETKIKSYKKCYQRLNPRKSAHLMPFDDDLTSIEVPSEHHISSGQMDISFVSDFESDDAPIKGVLDKKNSVSPDKSFMNARSKCKRQGEWE